MRTKLLKQFNDSVQCSVTHGMLLLSSDPYHASCYPCHVKCVQAPLSPPPPPARYFKDMPPEEQEKRTVQKARLQQLQQQREAGVLEADQNATSDWLENDDFDYQTVPQPLSLIS